MQAAINYSHAHSFTAIGTGVKANIIRKEARMKIALFAGILLCLALAVNI